MGSKEKKMDDIGLFLEYSFIFKEGNVGSLGEEEN